MCQPKRVCVNQSESVSTIASLVLYVSKLAGKVTFGVEIEVLFTLFSHSNCSKCFSRLALVDKPFSRTV